MTSKIINLDLQSRSYDIVIGDKILGNLSKFFPKISSYSKVFVITDENVAKNHLEKLNSALKEIGAKSHVLTLAPGEQTKSFGVLEKVCEEILAIGVDRKSLIIAFGGGVIGDLAGFVASILLRGIDFIQIPTTLLAAVDSSVGGKTAIDSRSGKNLIGAFYQPKLVLCDLELLQTLSKRDFLSGYAEVVKYGLVYDEKFFDFLEENCGKILKQDSEVLTKIISRSCEIKAEIVAKDEKENNLRAILNFGHTFGHALETETGYSSELTHGEAVALGMILAAKMSCLLGLIDEKTIVRIEKHFNDMGLPVSHKKVRKDWNLNNLVAHLYRDKKVENGKLTFILIDGIGKYSIKKDVSEKLFLEVVG